MGEISPLAGVLILAGPLIAAYAIWRLATALHAAQMDLARIDQIAADTEHQCIGHPEWRAPVPDWVVRIRAITNPQPPAVAEEASHV